MVKSDTKQYLNTKSAYTRKYKNNKETKYIKKTIFQITQQMKVGKYHKRIYINDDKIITSER